MRCELYLSVASVAEALVALAGSGGEACVVAGGTDLMVSMSQGGAKWRALVDITAIADLHYVREEDGRVLVGPLVTHAELASSSVIQRRASALAAAALSVGSPQIRNVGTVGGNIVNALPAADAALALVALDARAEVTGSEGTRCVDLLDLYAGVRQSLVDSSREILTGISFEAPSGSDFQRLARRKALALPVLNAAAAVWLDGDRVCRKARVAVAPVGSKPWRPSATEGMLVGQLLSEERIAEAARAASEEAVCRDSIRGCSEYREAMVAVLVGRALRASAARAHVASSGGDPEGRFT